MSVTVVKAIVLLLIFIVLFGLFRALYFLVTQRGEKSSVANNLTLRVLASAGILLFLGFARWMGWYEFNGSPGQVNKPATQIEQPQSSK
jgi:hypothetical protein